jgi:hypothetical protein
MRLTLPAALLSLMLIAASVSQAQTKQPSMPDMPVMDMNAPQMSMGNTTMKMGMNMMKQPSNLIDAELAHTNSGTSIEPASTPVAMIMKSYRGWMPATSSSPPTGSCPWPCVS